MKPVHIPFLQGEASSGTENIKYFKLDLMKFITPGILIEYINQSWATLTELIIIGDFRPIVFSTDSSSGVICRVEAKEIDMNSWDNQVKTQGQG